jgi:hypothetical protein
VTAYGVAVIARDLCFLTFFLFASLWPTGDLHSLAWESSIPLLFVTRYPQFRFQRTACPSTVTRQEHPGEQCIGSGIDALLSSLLLVAVALYIHQALGALNDWTASVCFIFALLGSHLRSIRSSRYPPTAIGFLLYGIHFSISLSAKSFAERATSRAQFGSCSWKTATASRQHTRQQHGHDTALVTNENEQASTPKKERIFPSEA